MHTPNKRSTEIDREKSRCTRAHGSFVGVGQDVPREGQEGERGREKRAESEEKRFTKKRERERDGLPKASVLITTRTPRVEECRAHAENHRFSAAASRMELIFGASSLSWEIKV